MHLVITFIRKLSSSQLWGELSSGNPVLFGSHWFESLQHIQGIKVETIIRGSGKDHVIKLWIRDDIGYDIETPDDFERLKQRESEAL